VAVGARAALDAAAAGAERGAGRVTRPRRLVGRRQQFCRSNQCATVTISAVEVLRKPLRFAYAKLGRHYPRVFLTGQFLLTHFVTLAGVGLLTLYQPMSGDHFLESCSPPRRSSCSRTCSR
jgi:hypothetical protein